MTIFSLEELKIVQKRKGDGISKEEFHATTLGRNRGRRKKTVKISII
jgi:hypothetical protein